MEEVELERFFASLKEERPVGLQTGLLFLSVSFLVAGLGTCAFLLSRGTPSEEAEGDSGGEEDSSSE